MNLVIDIGNSSTKSAVFEGETLLETVVKDGQSTEGLADFFRKYAIHQAIASSVVELTDNMKDALKHLPTTLHWLNKETPLPIINLYETPETLGYDRIAAVVGAITRFPGKDILVIDAGTAITYEFIDATGHYHGGNISPGTNMRLKALHQFTSKLPLVSAEGRVLQLGKDTETAIRSGVMKGIEYEIKGYIEALKPKYPGLFVFLTGGETFSFDTSLKNIIFADKFLVLRGLNRILNDNKW
jgi:type III pantothenate kinase